MARPVIGRRFPGATSALLLASLCLASGCSKEDRPPLCEAPVTASFATLGEGSVAVRTLEGIRVEVLTGDAEGYHDGSTWTLLALQGTTLGLTPPCLAGGLELVLDDTQVGLTVTAYEDPWDRVSVGSASSNEAVPIAENPPYRRLTVNLSEGARAGYVEVEVSGAACTDQCYSVLLGSVTFQ